MTKLYEFDWQKSIPEFVQEGAIFDRFEEVRAHKPPTSPTPIWPEDLSLFLFTLRKIRT